MKTKLLVLLTVSATLFAASTALAQTPASTPAAAAPAPDAAALYQRSLESLQAKKIKEAIELAEQAVKADPTKADYYAHLGVAISSRMGEVNFMQAAALSGKLRKAFEKAVELDPKHVGGLIGLVRYYSNAPEIAGGSPAKAKEFAERVVAIDPLLGQVELGRLAEKAEDYAGALSHYDAAAKLKPDSSGMAFASGRMLVKLGKKDEARTRFEKALALKPDHEQAKKALADLDAPAAK